MGSISIARSILRLRQTTLDNSPKPKPMLAWEDLGIPHRFHVNRVVLDCLRLHQHSHETSHAALYLRLISAFATPPNYCGGAAGGPNPVGRHSETSASKRSFAGCGKLSMDCTRSKEWRQRNWIFHAVTP
jgi:hypothetical protein